MSNQTIGQVIADIRKQKGMTQADLAKKMHITDKAVSKWERDLSCPDINSIPKLADILGISVEELMNTSARPKTGQSVRQIVSLVLKAIPLAAGVAVVVLSVLKQLDTDTAMVLLGLGMACLGISALEQ